MFVQHWYDAQPLSLRCAQPASKVTAVTRFGYKAQRSNPSIQNYSPAPLTQGATTAPKRPDGTYILFHPHLGESKEPQVPWQGFLGDSVP